MTREETLMTVQSSDILSVPESGMSSENLLQEELVPVSTVTRKEPRLSLTLTLCLLLVITIVSNP